jgi:asparagine N-glycosylation enzyme membrane subunit Stt3
MGWLIGKIPTFFTLPIELATIIGFGYLSFRMHKKKNDAWSFAFLVNTILSIILSFSIDLTLSPVALTVGILSGKVMNLTLFSEIFLFLFALEVSLDAVFKKENNLGMMLLVWLAFTFFAISSGIRFTLLFAMAAAIGTAIGFAEMVNALKEEKHILG